MKPFNFTAPYADETDGPCSCQSDSCLHGGEPAADPSRLARLWLEVNEGLGRLRRAGLEECERLWDANGTERSE